MRALSPGPDTKPRPAAAAGGVPLREPLPREPIAAIATAPGRGAVGIVRISGTGLAPLARAICARELAPRHAHYGAFLDADGQAIDHGLALYFPAPHSYTGEDVLELQAHGGPVVLQLLLARCLALAGAPGVPSGLRLARPGEFSERAFLNDKIDLAQAEAIADLIDASTEAAARSAARAAAGIFSQRVDALAARLVELRALVEATLDFPEEEIDFLESAGARARIDGVLAALDEMAAGARQGALLREGLRVVLAGQPNVGKSSLLNALAGAELAIVTPIPGTTRDRIGETIQIEGVPLHVVDTAGLREAAHAADEVERLGMARSWEAIRDADAVVFLHDLTRRGDPAYEAGETAIAAELAAHGPPGAVLQVWNKADAAGAEADAVAGEAGAAGAAIVLSARSGQGLDALRRTLLERAGWQARPEGVFIARARHLHSLGAARAHVAAAAALAAQRDAGLELLAEELRLAHRALGEITGQFGAEELLGEIFGRFCIGK
ncbi:MAG: tRNA uridine-5-carboxymethylaminomethyl(34) synthesis GTPase MnmE [Burkholderiales bacterium]|nr:tRNA uridine-5-carboxymethylaminomethyl(34) synthesis GTPase MnmE [Burkholderiales bacterium]